MKTLEQKYIEALEKIIELQNEIKFLKDNQSLFKPTLTDPFGNGPIKKYGPQFDWEKINLQNYCDHDFPSPWAATTPPSCKKCGKQAEMLTVVSTSTGE